MGDRYINIVSWNINGCSTRVKRKKILTYLKSENTDVAFIQETHFRNEEEAQKLRRDWVGKVFHNSVSSKSCWLLFLSIRNSILYCYNNLKIQLDVSYV